MRWQWLAALVLVGALGAEAAAQPVIRTVGGEPTVVGEFPNTVAVMQMMGSGGVVTIDTCTGTLIAPTWVLTAAHCVFAPPGATQQQITAATTVLFGTVDTRGGNSVAAKTTVPDPQYDPAAFGVHDIGLVELAAPITDIAPAQVCLDASLAPIGVQVTTIGFGDDHLGTEYEVVNTSEACPSPFGDGMDLCFPQTSTYGIGDGDSGGPSFATVRGRLLEVGVTSSISSTGSGAGAMQRTDAAAAFLTAQIPTLDCKTGGCPGALTCAGSTCVAAACSASAPCGSGQACFAGGCIAAPHQPGGVGATCATGADCDGGYCYEGTAVMRPLCVIACSIGSNGAGSALACPAGFACTAVADLGDPSAGLCFASAAGAGSGGCSAGAGSGGGLLVVAAIALRRRRSRDGGDTSQKCHAAWTSPPCGPGTTTT
jgi:V8-like Glu-specific endopeptidase